MLRPIGEFVLIEFDEFEQKTESGIVLAVTQAATQKPTTGTVIAVGEYVLQVKAGDRVLFSNFKGTEITHNGIDYLVTTEEGIFAVIE